uniref:phenylalanine--tRNA ligase subunit alpha n=1 Tax=Alicyclobacillus dauci TaxID=1475485 RepID=UPI0038995CEE
MRDHAVTKLASVSDTKSLNEWRVAYLGKKSEVSGLAKQMGGLAPEERPKFGQLLNDVRQALEAEWEEKRNILERAEQNARLSAETIDITLPGRETQPGAYHPISRVIREIEDVFLGMGFMIADGPEVETDLYNFEMLNLPKDHPARDMQDTFYITDELLMRTHTSPMQVRTMQRMHPQVPVKVLVPGRVYRRDEDDATHSHAFTQIEGLVVDKNIRMSDLKGILEQFAKALFGENQRVRLRPSFFPFTEPSAEVDLVCVHCGGDGCRVCKETGWIEILGSGMVHPRVLDMAGYDSSIYSGFAFGMGAERIAMLKYGITDIRQLYQNDLRFLRQFTGA